MLEKLYTKDVLRLTTSIPHLGRLDNPDGTATEKSTQCGSTITVDIVLKDGKVAAFAQDVKACALAQASAAIAGAQIIGKTPENLTAAYEELKSMLKNNGSVPAAPWDGYKALEGVRDFAPRHDSVLLPLKTALAAVQHGTENR